MKTRRVLVSLEIETTMTVAQLRASTEVGFVARSGAVRWHPRDPLPDGHELLQVQANAVKAKGRAK